MIEKTIVIISKLVDATIKEYQPDTEFLIFQTPQDFGIYVEQDPVRATTLFVTSDMLTNSNSTLTYLKQLVCDNEFVNIDHILLLMEEDHPARRSAEFIIAEENLDNWEIQTRSKTRPYEPQVINGTYRNESTHFKRKAVYRVPRADYVKQKLRERDTLDEPYADDDNDLADIPDIEVPPEIVSESVKKLEKYYIVGDVGDERTALAFLSAQYLSESGKTIIVEPDCEYHTLTEFVTKSGVDCQLIEIKDLYESINIVLETIRKTEHKLIVIGAIERTQYSYAFVVNLLYYSLLSDVDNFVVELPFSEIPYGRHITAVAPSTVIGALRLSEQLDKTMLPRTQFVGVNLNQLQEIHVNSGVVMSYILRDVFGDNSILCPVVTVTSLRLNGTIYDMGSILNGGNSE